MRRLLYEQEGALTRAMAADLGKPALEAWITDLAAIAVDIGHVLRHLDRWAAPRRVAVPLAVQPGWARVVPEPLGAVLVMGPWNYPVRCLLLPLAFAVAAGNATAVKPSELSPATSAALARLLPRYVDPEAVTVAEGGPEAGRALLAQRWDHVFFTGGGRVGRLVMEAAARHLTPVTLELGGKNPAIIERSAALSSAARRVAWGKFLNAGQTCVAPDYVLVDRSVHEPFVAALERRIGQFFGSDPRRSPDLARIVNDAHFERVRRLLTATAGQVRVGGVSAPAERYLAPTVVTGVGWDDPLMAEEIFAPVLPVLAYEDLGEALAELSRREKPLAVYLYTTDRAATRRVLGGTSSGAVCVNHNAVQLAVPGLPFGGVGSSGMGAYHGRHGFDTFSHQKAVLARAPRLELPLMYPPYSAGKRWVIERFLGRGGDRS